MPSLQDKELLRRAVLEMLVERAFVPQRQSAIRRRVATGLDFPLSDEDLEAALEYQRQGGFVTFIFDPDGATKWWHATRAGINLIERGPLPIQPA